MPSYGNGRWRITVADDGTVTVTETATVRETLDPSTFEARGEARPAYVPANQATTFLPLVRRSLHLIADRRLGWRIAPKPGA